MVQYTERLTIVFDIPDVVWFETLRLDTARLDVRLTDRLTPRLSIGHDQTWGIKPNKRGQICCYNRCPEILYCDIHHNKYLLPNYKKK